MPRDVASRVDIDRAAHLIGVFIADSNRDTFDHDKKTQSAVLHQLMTIGEAVKRLSPEYRTLHPAIPRNKIAGMRDPLIHAYDAVDLDQVWITSAKDIPALRATLCPLLPQIALEVEDA